MTLSQQLLEFTVEAPWRLLERGLRQANGGLWYRWMSIPPLPQGSVVGASIIHQRKSRLHIGSEHAEENRWSINLRHLLHYLTFLSQMSPSPRFWVSFTAEVTLEEMSAEVTLKNKCLLLRFGQAGIRPCLGRVMQHLARLSLTAPATVCIARMALRLTQPYIVPDRRTSKIMSAVAHLLLDVFSICWLPQHGGSGCKIYLGQRYYVSNPCSLSQQFRGVWSTITPFVSIQ